MEHPFGIAECELRIADWADSADSADSANTSGAAGARVRHPHSAIRIPQYDTKRA
jgi:hypothetical protein